MRRTLGPAALTLVLGVVVGACGVWSDDGPTPPSSSSSSSSTTSVALPPTSSSTTSTALPPPTTTTTLVRSLGRIQADLATTVDRLVADARAGSPELRVSISVQAVAAGSLPVSVEPRLPFLAGSAAKAYWAAAATAARGPAAVEPEATQIFEWSDNDAAGRVVDLADPNALNLFLAGPVGAEDTAFYFWGFGGEGRGSALYPGPFGGNNPTTTADAVRFMVRLDRGDLLGPAGTEAMRDWLGRSPRDTSHPSTWGGLFGDRLPAAVQAGVLHKGGWLPGEREDRSCCADFDDLFIDSGIFETPAGDRWAVSVAVSEGGDVARNADVVRRSVCEIYRTVSADDTWDCGTLT